MRSSDREANESLLSYLRVCVCVCAHAHAPPCARASLHVRVDVCASCLEVQGTHNPDYT